MRKTRFKTHIMGLALLAGLSVLIMVPPPAWSQFFFMENQDVGKEVKDFTLKLLNGEETSLKEYRDGKKTIVFFWATWCPHCRGALESMSKRLDEITEKNIKIVSVDVGEEEKVVNKYAEKHKIGIDIFLDVESKVSDDYDLIGVPTFYFVDEKGIVLDIKHSIPADLEAAFSKT